MDTPCPFWEGKRVRDTHLLALIPSHVVGKPLTLDYLGKLSKDPKEGYGTRCLYSYHVHPAIGNQSPDSSYGVLMTKDVLPGSRSKSYEDQCALVADHANRTGLSCKVPRALEATVVMLLHHVRSGERSYSTTPLTYTRCREKANDHQVIVGGFSSWSLAIYEHNDAHENIGIAGLRKF